MTDGRFYEDARREGLILWLGQVHCSIGMEYMDYGWHVWPMDKPCARCGAAI